MHAPFSMWATAMFAETFDTTATQMPKLYAEPQPRKPTDESSNSVFSFISLLFVILLFLVTHYIWCSHKKYFSYFLNNQFKPQYYFVIVVQVNTEFCTFACSRVAIIKFQNFERIL